MWVTMRRFQRTAGSKEKKPTWLRARKKNLLEKVNSREVKSQEPCKQGVETGSVPCAPGR